MCVCSLTDTRVSLLYESIINVKNMYNQSSYPLFLTFSSDTYIVLCWYCCCIVKNKILCVLHTNVLWCASCHYIRFHASWYLWHVFLFFLFCSFTTLTTSYWRRKNKQQQQKIWTNDPQFSSYCDEKRARSYACINALTGSCVRDKL